MGQRVWNSAAIIQEKNLREEQLTASSALALSLNHLNYLGVVIVSMVMVV